MSQVTKLLEQIPAGDSAAPADLLPLVYRELRELAACQLAKEAAGQTLQPTALVHEAWVRLTRSGPESFANRAHFIGTAAEAMRRILIDRARSKARIKHGGDRERVDLTHVTVAVEDASEVVLALNEALERLAAIDPPKAEVVKLSYFVGMTQAEIALSLGISEPTVRRYWAFARAWLYAELQRK